MSGYARSVALTGADQAALAGAGVYRGFVAVETSGTDAATIRLYDNASAASGTLIGAANLAAGASADVHCDPVWVENGIYVDVGGTGTVDGSVRIG